MRLLHYHINRTMGSEGMLSIECPSSLFMFLCLHVYALYSPINSKSIQPNRMTFGEMIGYYPHQ